MLIYNQNKEFIGIDDEDLKHLGFSTVRELLAECNDIAELFIKKPGYIHNFKNFQWIDFVMHAEAETSKAIVHTSKKNFLCDIAIKPFHMMQTPNRESFAIYLQHIRPLNASEKQAVEEAPATSFAPPIGTAYEESEEISADDLLSGPGDLFGSDDTAPGIQGETEPETNTAAFDPYATADESYPEYTKPLEVDEDIFLQPEEETTELPEEIADETAPVKDEIPMLGDYLNPDELNFIDNLQTPKDYTYDPQVASDELGLPVDLIEEFIGDFIQQSHEYHDELFHAAEKPDFDSIKTLSHKLKGVAANLRVEDAFEMLAVINKSHDQVEVEANLKTFYNTIAKLEGKEVAPMAAAPVAQESAAVSDTPSMVSDETPTAPESPVEEKADEDIYSFDLLKKESPVPAEQTDELQTPEMASEDEPLQEESASADDLDLAEAEKEIELPPIESIRSDEQTPVPSSEPEEPIAAMYYDAQKAANELGLDVGLIQELKKDFVDDANHFKGDFQDAAKKVQSDKWHNCASQLKGIAENLRMQEIAATLHTLTQTEDPEQAEKSIHQLYSYVDQL